LQSTPIETIVENNLVENNDLDASQFEWWDGGIWLDGGGDVRERSHRQLATGRLVHSPALPARL
jgi:hypothetical protein